MYEHRVVGREVHPCMNTVYVAERCMHACMHEHSVVGREVYVL